MSQEPVARSVPPAGKGAKLALLAVALVVAFGLCEVAARLMFPAPPQVAREPQILYQSHREIGFLHVPNQTGWLDDGLATINAIGLRGAAPAIPKPPKTVRVLAVGDSMTFGWGVGDDETYPAILERLLREAFPDRTIEVVNGGVGAFNLEQAGRLLEHFAPSLRPDVVLVGLFWNDLPLEGISPNHDPGPTAASTGAAAVRAAPSAPTASKPFRIGNNPSRLNRLLRSSRLLFALRHAYLAVIAPTEAATQQTQWEMAILEGRDTPAIEAAWDNARAALAGIGAQGHAAGFDVGVLTMPIRAQVEGSYPDAAYQDRVAPLARSLGLFVVDPLPFFREHATSGLFIPYDRMHLTARGNALVARAAFEALRLRPEFLEPSLKGVGP